MPNSTAILGKGGYAVGGWRSALLEVGGGYIADFGLGIGDLTKKAGSEQLAGDRGQPRDKARDRRDRQAEKH